MSTELVDLVLVDSGKKVIHIIKEIRSIIDAGLAQAKDLAEKTPSVIATGVPKNKAQAAASQLEALGATVELRPATGGSGALEGGPGAALELLVDKGVISENEKLDAATALDQAASGEYRNMVKMLTELHHLYEEGVLSESEFNSKKWDVLARK